MSPVKSWGSCSSGSCNGMIGMLQREEFDLAMSGMSISFDRHKYVDFSFPYMLDRITFVVRAAQPLDPTDAIVRPFTQEVWIFLFATVIVSLLIRYFARVLCMGCHGYMNLLEIHGLLLGKGVAHLPETISQKTLFSAWLVLSLVISATYSGSLFSSITHPALECAVDSIPKLTNALQKKKIKCGTLRGTDFEAALQEETPLSPSTKAILTSLQTLENYVSNDVEGLERCRNGAYAYVGEYIGVLADVKEQGTFTFADDSFQLGAYGVAIRRFLNITEKLNRIVVRLWDSGLVGFWLKQSTIDTRKSRRVQSADPLTLKHMMGAVNVLWGLPLSLSVFLGETCVKYHALKKLQK